MHRWQSASSSRCLGLGPMADNPFDPKNIGLLGALGGEPPRNALADYVSSLTPKPEVSPMVRAIANLLMDKPVLPVNSYPYGSGLGDVFGTLAPTALPANPSYNALAGFFAPPAPPSSLLPPVATRSFGSLADLVAGPAPPSKALYTPPAKPVSPSVKRKAFFSFHFPDSLRVNNVRNIWKIKHPSSEGMRTFQDSSLWEARKLTDPKAIKAIIRYGVSYTSAVCVLVGTETWSRRWVRYEIARAIIDGKGLLAVHLNNINHHKTLSPHPLGRNPLDFLAIRKVQPNLSQAAKYFLYEKLAVPDGAGGYRLGWYEYEDHTDAVDLPRWVTDPPVGHVTPLSENADEYDFTNDVGHKHIGSWLDRAAQRAGR
jgi:hypothetical protein